MKCSTCPRVASEKSRRGSCARASGWSIHKGLLVWISMAAMVPSSLQAAALLPFCQLAHVAKPGRALANDARRHARGDAVRWNVARDQRPGADDCPVADGDVRHQDSAPADPHVAPQPHMAPVA